MALSKLAVRRLTKLADFMASLPKSADRHFDMGMWFAHEGDHTHNFSGNALSRDDLKLCGTTACALGWGATMPYFKRLGLTVSTTNGALRFRGKYDPHPMVLAADICDIEITQAIYLFDSRSQVRTTKEWAKLCRTFIKENS